VGQDVILRRDCQLRLPLSSSNGEADLANRPQVTNLPHMVLKMIVNLIAFLLAFAALLPAAEEYSYWIEPCPPETARKTGCQANDPELGRWALEAWQREAAGAVAFRKSATEEHARFRMYWVGGNSGLYGETQPAIVDGKRGARIYVLPSVAPGADALLRDAIVYLTCLHESGHALGLAHTSVFADIMYSFQFGGDITAYFNRYRVLLKTRADIAAHSGISDADRVALGQALRQ
jgi:hypothetical protein